MIKIRTAMPTAIPAMVPELKTVCDPDCDDNGVEVVSLVMLDDVTVYGILWLLVLILDGRRKADSEDVEILEEMLVTLLVDGDDTVLWLVFDEDDAVLRLWWLVDGDDPGKMH
jgi:hypothetical protein